MVRARLAPRSRRWIPGPARLGARHHTFRLVDFSHSVRVGTGLTRSCPFTGALAATRSWSHESNGRNGDRVWPAHLVTTTWLIQPGASNRARVFLRPDQIISIHSRLEARTSLKRVLSVTILATRPITPCFLAHVYRQYRDSSSAHLLHRRFCNGGAFWVCLRGESLDRFASTGTHPLSSDVKASFESARGIGTRRLGLLEGDAA